MIVSSIFLINGLFWLFVKAAAISSGYDSISVKLEAGREPEYLGSQSVFSDTYDAASLKKKFTTDKRENDLEFMVDVEETKKTLIKDNSQGLKKYTDTTSTETEKYSYSENNNNAYMLTTAGTEIMNELSVIPTSFTIKSLNKEYDRQSKNQRYPPRPNGNAGVDYVDKYKSVPQDRAYNDQTTQVYNIESDKQMDRFDMKNNDSEQETSDEEDVSGRSSLDMHNNKLTEHQLVPLVHQVLPRFNINGFDVSDTNKQMKHKLVPTNLANVTDYRHPIVVQTAPGLPTLLLSFTKTPPRKNTAPNKQMTAMLDFFATQSTFTTLPPFITTANIIPSSLRPVGKHINTQAGVKLFPYQQLRKYIEDAYIRMPLAVIVDPSVDSLKKTKALWNEALQTNLNIKIILITLNDSGITSCY